MSNTPAREPTVGERLGLGAVWQPGPGRWRWARLTAENGVPLHILISETTGGTAALTMTEEDLRELIRQAQEKLTGISLARGLLPEQLPHNGRP